MKLRTKILGAILSLIALSGYPNIGVGLVSEAKAQSPPGGSLFGVTNLCCSPDYVLPNQFVLIDPATGALTPLSIVGGTTFAFSNGASAVDVAARRFFLVRYSAGVPHIIAINTQTGAVVESPTLSRSLLFLGFESSTGSLFGVTNLCCSPDYVLPNQFVLIDPATGAFTALSIVGDSTSGFANDARAVDVAAHRFFLVRNGAIIAINTQTGAVVESPTLSRSLFFLGFDSSTGSLFGVTACCPHQFVLIDPATGAFTPLSIVGDSTSAWALGASAVDVAAHRFFLVRNGAIIAINTQTGAVVESPTLSRQLFALGFEPLRTVSPIPTLSEWAYLGMALILVGVAAWALRRRRGLAFGQCPRRPAPLS